MRARFVLPLLGMLVLAAMRLCAAGPENGPPVSEVGRVNQLLSKAYWMWDDMDTTAGDRKSPRVFTKEFEVDGAVGAGGMPGDGGKRLHPDRERSDRGQRR